MILSLNLTNFRRHASTELRFDEAGQIILIAGENGVGKTTILEAITFAYFGETRHGKRNLDQLVRRGHELEGMQVELTFLLGDDEYRIQRRRDGRSVTAVLSANGIPLVEGPNAVTDAVIRLLGMDSTGFRLAVISQQKDLDGLASLRPAERSVAVRRLLRLDALTAASTEAQAEFRRRRDLVREIRPTDSVEMLTTNVALTAADVDTAENERLRSAEAVAAISQELEHDAHIDTSWKNAVAHRDSIAERVTRESAEVAHLRSEVDALVVPADVPDFEPVDSVSAALAVAERTLALAENDAKTLSQRASTQAELDRVIGRIDALPSLLSDPAVGVTEAEAALAKALAELSAASESNECASETWHTHHAELAHLRDRLEQAGSVGAVCECCGQAVSETHRLNHLAELEDAIEAAEDRSEALKLAVVASRLAFDRATSEVDIARSALVAANAAVAGHARDIEERSDLERRRETYTAQLSRLVVTGTDLAQALRNRDDLAESLSRSVQLERDRQGREVALVRSSELQRSYEQATLRLQSAQAELASASVDPDLAARWEQRLERMEDLAEETRLERHFALEVVAARGRHDAALAALQRHQDAVNRVQEHETVAVTASHAAALLTDTADQLSTRVRPMLEATMGQLLHQMSGGRFESVRIDDDYQVTVSDDGAFRPLSELSGGETDLVALAMRLALSQVVADRAGTGPGFLTLDECFASQEAGRRASVMAALRSLRPTYRQIFLISHVENIEDVADTVIEVSLDDERTAEVTTS